MISSTIERVHTSLSELERRTKEIGRKLPVGLTAAVGGNLILVETGGLVRLAGEIGRLPIDPGIRLGLWVGEVLIGTQFVNLTLAATGVAINARRQVL